MHPLIRKYRTGLHPQRPHITDTVHYKTLSDEPFPGFCTTSHWRVQNPVDLSIVSNLPLPSNIDVLVLFVKLRVEYLATIVSSNKAGSIKIGTLGREFDTNLRFLCAINTETCRYGIEDR